jgi:ribosomal peptide maturation radical SAM protein 1
MKFREKSADRVISELGEITERHNLKRVCMVDNIMPYHYFKTLLPRLGDEVPSLQMFYEQKANLSLNQVLALKEAGVAIIQPGIEALATGLLRLMDKGVTARQNIALLRYARSAEMDMNWNLLYGFPGDDVEDYRLTLSLMPALRHLAPPTDLCRLSVDRFSPYFFASERYGIRSLRPMESYYSVLPEGAEVEKVAYHFLGEYDSGSLSDLDLLRALTAEIALWKQVWSTEGEPPPALAVVRLSLDQFVLLDSRGIEGALPVRFLDREETMAVLVQRPLKERDSATDWAMENRLAVELDGWHVPLATAAPDLLHEFEQEWSGRTPRLESFPLPLLQQSKTA